MIDKEFMMYRIGVSNKIRPNGVNYRTEAEAKDAAKRFAEREHCTYYVFEVCEVVNTIAEVRE